MPSEESRPSSVSEVPKRWLAKTARLALLEVAWLLGSAAAATAFCFIAPEYGYDPVPFFTICFYLLTGLVRLLLHLFLRSLRQRK
jgi:hypothetical protein